MICDLGELFLVLGVFSYYFKEDYAFDIHRRCLVGFKQQNDTNHSINRSRILTTCGTSPFIFWCILIHLFFDSVS